MNNEKFLPIGTVVMLKGGSKRVMITGFLTYDGEDSTKMYDYNGCMYPEGVLSSTTTLLFNHDQIEKVFYMGLIDDEEKEFKNKLREAINKENLAGDVPAPVQPVQPESTDAPIPVDLDVDKPLISEETPKQEEGVVDTIPIISLDD